MNGHSQNQMQPRATEWQALTNRQPVDQNPARVYLARLAPGSRRTMAHALEVIANMNGQAADTLPWSQLRYQHTQAIRARLAERYSPGGVNKMLAALRGVLKEAWRLGQMNAETYQRAADLKNIRSETLPTGRALTKKELQKLFLACTGANGARDAAMISVLYGGGLRRSEAVSLSIADYNRETGELQVRAGKGRKDRTVYATNGSKDALEAWLAVRGEEPGPLFWPGDGKGRPLVNRRMTDQTVRLMLRRRAKQAKIRESFTPHDLRRTFISDLLDAGADLPVVQRMAGHANIQTTARYDRRGEESKRRASELLHVPFNA